MAKLQGCGLGLRSNFLLDVKKSDFQPDWWEVTPEKIRADEKNRR